MVFRWHHVYSTHDVSWWDDFKVLLLDIQTLWEARGVQDVDQDNHKTLKTPSKSLAFTNLWLKQTELAEYLEWVLLWKWSCWLLVKKYPGTWGNIWVQNFFGTSQSALTNSGSGTWSGSGSMSSNFGLLLFLIGLEVCLNTQRLIIYCLHPLFSCHMSYFGPI